MRITSIPIEYTAAVRERLAPPVARSPHEISAAVKSVPANGADEGVRSRIDYFEQLNGRLDKRKGHYEAMLMKIDCVLETIQHQQAYLKSTLDDLCCT